MTQAERDRANRILELKNKEKRSTYSVLLGYADSDGEKDFYLNKIEELKRKEHHD
jgi:hypothetical protein